MKQYITIIDTTKLYMAMTEATITDERHTDADYQKNFKASKEAIRYFEAMKKAHEAMGELIQSQLDYAIEVHNSHTQTKINHEE